VAELENHLSLCDFCRAETELYKLYYSPVDDEVTAGRIPQPLLELAESLLHKKNDLTPLYNLIERNG
jgi:hypothetical protein